MPSCSTRCRCASCSRTARPSSTPSPGARPARILAAYRAHAAFTDAELKRFVRANFVVPEDAPAPPPSQDRTTLKAHIAALWPVLTRPPVQAVEGDSALPLDKPFVVPGGRFREIYYWDSYFTMLGLAADGQPRRRSTNMVDDFGGLIDRYGHIPNGDAHLLSEPLAAAVLLRDGGRQRGPDKTDKARFKRCLDLMRREHAFWMDGEKTLARARRIAAVVALPDGAILNRYADDRSTPRDESYRGGRADGARGHQPSGRRRLPRPALGRRKRLGLQLALDGRRQEPEDHPDHGDHPGRSERPAVRPGDGDRARAAPT